MRAQAISPQELRAARDRLGLTQVEFAAILGADSITVSRWERGAQTINAGWARLGLAAAARAARGGDQWLTG